MEQFTPFVLWTGEPDGISEQGPQYLEGIVSREGGGNRDEEV